MDDRVEVESGPYQKDRVSKKRNFSHWLGERKDGEWVRESIAIPNMTRTVSHFAKSEKERNDDGSPVIVRVEREEMVYNHQGFHPHIEGEKKPRRAFFFRGARVWRD